MIDLLLSTTLLASFLSGVVALLAPCCVSVMLPAYFASTFRTRWGIVAMTGVFAAGIATVIVPIALGVSALSRLFAAQHTVIFLLGGVLMAAMGITMLAGKALRLPLPSMSAGRGRGTGATYLLGVFSGIASACCAPVLAGVAVVSGAAGSFPAALAVGGSYVFGMVAPLAVLALCWERRDWGSARWLNGREVRIGRYRTPMWLFLSGGLLLAMGVLTIVLAFTAVGMDPAGWTARVAAELQHWIALALDVVHGVPGIVTSLAVLIAAAWFIGGAVRGRNTARGSDTHACCPPESGARQQTTSPNQATSPNQE